MPKTRGDITKKLQTLREKTLRGEEKAIASGVLAELISTPLLPGFTDH